MTGPSSSRIPTSPPSVRPRLLLAWAAIAWERLWVGLWPALTLAIFGAAVALTDVLPSLPGFVHLIVLTAFLGGLGWLGWRHLKDFTWPSRSEARARLEASSPVAHRPLTATEDTLALGASPIEKLIWQRHQRLARAALDRLRSPWPAPGVARLDGYAVRTVAILLLVVAVIGTRGDITNRLTRALTPVIGESGRQLTVKLWVTPPAYTNHPPIYVELPSADAGPKTLEIPAGSKALVVVTGTRRATSLVLEMPKQKATVLPLAALDVDEKTQAADDSRRLETVLTPAQRMEVRQGARILAGWDVAWLADTPPLINFAGTPRDAGRGRLRIDYTAQDDYGVQAVVAEISRTENVDGTVPVLAVPLSVPPFTPKEVTHTALQDLAAHPWAGLKVSIRLLATDQAGQSTRSASIDAVLPERNFTHPVARELAKWRKDLSSDPDRAALPARESFAQLMEHPEAFNGDRVVYLALASAKYRLSYAPAREAVAGLPELLWHTAVRIEDGNLGASEEKLQAAERALQEAMENGASPEELGRLLDQMQRALAEYTRALAERMPDKGLELSGVDKQGNIVSPENISQMLEQLRKLSQLGAKDAAKQMMSNLQNMLQTLRNAAAGAGADNPELKAAEQLMREMREVTEKQSELLNDSFEQARQDAVRGPQQNQPGSQGQQGPQGQQSQQGQGQKGEGQKGGESGAGGKAADKQEQLRKQLSDLMGRMAGMTGQPTPGMSEADSAMRQAENALKAGAWKPAADAQGNALAKLESGMDQASQQMMQALAKKGLSGMMQMPGGKRRDGMGQRNGENDGEQVEVPNGPDTEGMAQRVRAILEEIRKRASDRTRPTPEQEYLRRLMKEF